MSETEASVIAPAPRANPLLLGQTAAEGTLLKAVACDRAARSWLFTGPKGVGKATLAFRFARWLLARHAIGGATGTDRWSRGFSGTESEGQGDALAIPPEHPVFRRVASGGHADLLTVEPAFDAKRGVRKSEIGVGNIRTVTGFLSSTSAEGGWRVVIIDAADTMNHNAANALLKTLEEPRPGCVLILVSQAPGALPATIRSRCQRLRLAPLDPATIRALIGRYAPETPQDEAETLAKLSRGSIGYALQLASHDLARFDRMLTLLFRSFPDLDHETLRQLSDSVGPVSGEPFALVADLMRSWLSSILRVASGAAPEDIIATEGACLRRLAAAASLDRWLEVWEKSTHLLARTETANMDPRQIVFGIFLHVECMLRR